MMGIWNYIMKLHYGNDKINSGIDSDSCYLAHRDALPESIIPHGFATKTKGAMAYFIAVSGMIFIGKSNQQPRIKQIKFWINLEHGNVKIMILWKFLGKLYFKTFNRLQWKGTPGDEKICSKYEKINDKEEQQQLLVWVVDQYYGVITKKIQHHIKGVPG
eukprot:84679_1